MNWALKSQEVNIFTGVPVGHPFYANPFIQIKYLAFTIKKTKVVFL